MERFQDGPQICYESLFPKFARSLSDLGAQFTVNATNDSWYGTWQEPYQHMYMTLARGVEFRRPVLRATNTGISTVSLASGEVLEMSPMNQAWTKLYHVPYITKPGSTFYQEWFYLVPVLLWSALFILLGWACIATGGKSKFNVYKIRRGEMGIVQDLLGKLGRTPADRYSEKRFAGIANPSGAVALNNTTFIVADDEDNDLRIYDRNDPGKPIQKIELSKVFKGEIEDGGDQEIDLESVAGIAGTYFWLGSHSTSKKGDNRPARRRLLAVTIHQEETGRFEINPEGEIYARLIEDLQEDPRFNPYSFDEAGKIAPKEIGGLSIEGLAQTPERTLLIGFRNPLVGGEIKNNRLINGKALVVELLNPFEVIHRQKPRFADPVELDLEGFGIRDITWRKEQDYLIIAGPYRSNNAGDGQDSEEFRLYEWSRASGKIVQFKDIDLRGFNMEAALFYPDSQDVVQLLSDDGKLDKGDCFRSREFALPGLAEQD